MHRFRSLTLLALLLGLALAGQAAAETLYVASTGAILKAAASASSATVAELPLGAGLEVLQSDRRWYRVRTSSGREGWIYRGKVSPTKPQATATGGDQESVGDLLGGLTGSSIQANAADSSRSIRGLSPDAEAYAAQTGATPAAKQALDQVLAHPVSQQEITRFLQESKLGEYAQ